MSPSLEMASAKKPQSPKPPHTQPEKQAKARESYTNRFNSLFKSNQEKLEDYENKLQDGTFEDQEGEPENSGEQRKAQMQSSISHSMDRIEKMKAILDSGQEIPLFSNEITADYTYTNPDTKKIEKQETITLDLERKLQEFRDFYTTHNLSIPPNFDEQAQDIWERNSDEIQSALEQTGFNDILIVPENLSLTELSQKLKMDNGYYDAIKSNSTVSDLTGIPLSSTNTDKFRIILVHNAQNLNDHPELKQTEGKKAQDLSIDNSLSLDDYLIFQKKYNTESTKHLDENGWTWLLKTKSGARFVCSHWNPSFRELSVNARGADYSDGSLGCRPARYFV